jgi:hypothetical protein
MLPELILVLADEAQRFHERPELGRFREFLPADTERVIHFRSPQSQEHCRKDRLPCRSGTPMERRFNAPAIRFFEGEAARHNTIDEGEPQVRICQIFSDQCPDQVRYEPSKGCRADLAGPPGVWRLSRERFRNGQLEAGNHRFQNRHAPFPTANRQVVLAIETFDGVTATEMHRIIPATPRAPQIQRQMVPETAGCRRQSPLRLYVQRLLRRNLFLKALLGQKLALNPYGVLCSCTNESLPAAGKC